MRPEENHGSILFTHRGSVVIGGNPAKGDNRWANQSGLEVSVMDRKTGGAVPATFHVSSPDGPATEPVIFKRSRATTIGGFGAVIGGDSLGVIQSQGDDGFGTSNIAATNIYMRVQPGTTSIPKNTRGIAGYIGFGTAPGNGTDGIKTRLEVNSDGQVGIITGDLWLGAMRSAHTGK
jgi:hypothetical protein